MRLSRAAGVSAAAVALTVAGQLAPTSADAMTLESTVATGAAGSVVSWQVPAVHRDAVSVTNRAGATDASTVLTLRNDRAATAYRFVVHLPQAASMRLQPDGSITVSRNGGAIGSFRAPWARDASGRSVRTFYQLNGSTITQRIDTAGAQFPITADPHYSSGWVTGTVYFNKAETRTIASSIGFAGMMCAAAAGLMGGPVFAAGCAAVALQMNAQARTAASRGQCIKIKVTTVPTPVYLGTYIYSGGYCT